MLEVLLRKRSNLFHYNCYYIAYRLYKNNSYLLPILYNMIYTKNYHQKYTTFASLKDDDAIMSQASKYSLKMSSFFYSVESVIQSSLLLMIANKKALYLAIIFLFINLAFALPFKRVVRPAPTSFSPHKYRPSETIKIYRTMRQLVMYFWGKNQFKYFEKTFSKHAIKYGSYYVTLYNLIYLAFFIKSYLEDKQHKQEKISQIVSTYQSQVQLSLQDNYDDLQTKTIIAFLQNNLWILQKRKYSSLQTLTTQISIVKVIYSQDCKYKVLMIGVDELGISDLFGVLTISKQKMEMKLMKQYEDYLELFNNQQWKDFIYEGQSGDDFVWRGVWHSIDEQGDPNHSGLWILRRKFSKLNYELQL